MSEGQERRPVCRFSGRSEHTLDDKGRLNIATKFREALRKQGDERLMVTPVAPGSKCLRAYSLPEWEKAEMDILAHVKANPTPDAIRAMRYFIGGAEECAVDKQGRILLPAQLREERGLKKEVVVNAMITFLEIWGKDAWEAEFGATEQDLRDPGLALGSIGVF
ncbi:MAG: division/cell wall cluster transcriptional repressor MraZ [Thermodesulfobacteriota bacterium]